MAGTITVSQAYNFGPLTLQQGSLAYVVQCTPDAGSGVYPTQVAVQAAVIAAAPLSYGGLPAQDCKVEHLTDALYLCEVQYQRQQNKEQEPETGGPVIDFDTTGGTQHITVAKATTSYVPTGGTARDVKNVIGDDGKKVHGVDIGYGVYRFGEEWFLLDTGYPTTNPSGQYAATACSATYRAILKGLTYKTNAAAFRGFAIGEVLFEGASGRRVKGGMFAVNYKFAVSPNAANVAVGDITVTAKKGWQYLDVRMKDSANADRIVQIPAQANVHTVYDSGDFSALAIGEAAI